GLVPKLALSVVVVAVALERPPDRVVLLDGAVAVHVAVGPPARARVLVRVAVVAVVLGVAAEPPAWAGAAELLGGAARVPVPVLVLVAGHPARTARVTVAAEDVAARVGAAAGAAVVVAGVVVA